MGEKFYITTAIAYTSGKPHIGNTYEAVLADSIARYKRQRGFDVYLQTGTDEHGQKIEERALKNGMEPKQYVDNISAEVRRIWDLMGVSYDSFVRTTDEHHERVVQRIFRKMYDNGDIYKGTYSGLYCAPCESFWTESQLVDGKCPDCGREVSVSSEEAYFFRLSKYQGRLEKFFAENSEFILPVSRMNEMINNFIKPGLQDLCVSRTSIKWGIPVDFDDGHVVYVWLDALTNYITNIGYDVDNETDKFKKLWPADVQIIGKDIVRFHSIYWPCFLWSLGLELPKKIFGHPWLLTNNDKIGKSRGNAIYADDLVNKFGLDAVRFYLLHEMPFANDGNITYELLIDRINADLANVLGNLVQRTISMGHKYFDGTVINKNFTEEIDKDFIKLINELNGKVENDMDNYLISNAIDDVFDVLRASNKYIDDTTPWVLAKDCNLKDRLETVIYNLLESIRVCAVLLRPFINDTSEKILTQLNNRVEVFGFATNNKYELGEAFPLFQRMDKEKVLEEIYKENN